ncbi:cell wall-active antibiotics response protein LiaF [Jeotgalibacillus haloalkalitolerans]|uniref:Cell wall-active antibiotics response protein LiaF n=1 Tax=Jeotgalibacillus haloalkalitolerans TaxID=3104292 RepID=A0ABU5KQA0_9BACL|nr:cell wall-active antibiotics response protein LiaF [Jeotgalibacillus sp. HH7-29]MDZ5713419.1 cell wall-active antibiotics response protein LiaF [Jeotgalibacillus sp. HH7-29]
MEKLRQMSLSNWLTAGLIIVLIEIVVFNSGMIFSLVLSGGLLYFGRQSWQHMYGKILAGVGALMLLTAILSMVTLRILFVVLIIYLVLKYMETKKNPLVFEPVMRPEQDETGKEQLFVTKKPFFLNKWVGSHETPEHSYEWENIHLQNGIGDVRIDLSNTVLPDKEVFISLRNIAGKITILVPYELDISVQHSALAGEASILNSYTARLWNENVVYQSAGYDQAQQKCTILSSVWVGDIEVRRV